jgi:hypothetical protein
MCILGEQIQEPRLDSEGKKVRLPILTQRAADDRTVSQITVRDGPKMETPFLGGVFQLCDVDGQK